MDFNITTLEQLSQVTHSFALSTQPGDVLALQGDLGSGKTTFTKLLFKELGINQEVTSPTFILAQRYPWQNTHFAYHLDLYRLKTPEEVQALGIEDMLESQKNLVVIEWPRLAEQFLPSSVKYLHFFLEPDQTRKLKVV